MTNQLFWAKTVLQWFSLFRNSLHSHISDLLFQIFLIYSELTFISHPLWLDLLLSRERQRSVHCILLSIKTTVIKKKKKKTPSLHTFTGNKDGLNFIQVLVWLTYWKHWVCINSFNKNLLSTYYVWYSGCCDSRGRSVPFLNGTSLS